ncbi:MAG: hypothetical protein JWM86_532 [Thermoleophilia bacterium]|nr:hypothetical protein [Thermoleophilia bacterium]
MSRFRGRSRDVSFERAEATDDSVVRDAEESLVAALQESDTAVEAMQDSASGAGPDAAGDRRRWAVGAGVVLALLGVFVARRRR